MPGLCRGRGDRRHGETSAGSDRSLVGAIAPLGMVLTVAGVLLGARSHPMAIVVAAAAGFLVAAFVVDAVDRWRDGPDDGWPEQSLGGTVERR